MELTESRDLRLQDARLQCAGVGLLAGEVAQVSDALAQLRQAMDLIQAEIVERRGDSLLRLLQQCGRRGRRRACCARRCHGRLRQGRSGEQHRTNKRREEAPYPG